MLGPVCVAFFTYLYWNRTPDTPTWAANGFIAFIAGTAVLSAVDFFYLYYPNSPGSGRDYAPWILGMIAVYVGWQSSKEDEQAIDEEPQ